MMLLWSCAGVYDDVNVLKFDRILRERAEVSEVHLSLQTVGLKPFL